MGEVAELERGLDRTGSGDPWFVQVVGEPGIGKTRRLAELGLRAEHQRSRCLLVRRAQLIVKIADVKQHSVRRFESQALLTEALQSLPDPGSPTVSAVRVELAHDHFWRGEFAQMRQIAVEVSTRGADRARPLVILARVLASLAAFYQTNLDEARAQLAGAERALNGLPDGPFAERMMLSTQIGLAACRLERFDDARAHVRRGLRVRRNRSELHHPDAFARRGERPLDEGAADRGGARR